MTETSTQMTNTLKQLATHAHFFCSISVVAIHFYDPPSMPAEWAFATIGITFFLAIGIPPFGMLKPDQLVGKDKKTLAKHGFYESVAKVVAEEAAEKTKAAEKLE